MVKSAELLYLYVERSNFGIKQEQINFSSDYNVEFKKEKRSAKLSINKLENNSSFFDGNVINVNLIVGKNGVGKSSLMKLISFGMNNRREFLPSTIYFVIYKVEETIFFIEGSNSLLRQILGEEIGNNRTFSFFKFSNDKPIIVDPINSKNFFIESSYQASIPNLEWVELNNLRKEVKNYPINKELYPSVSFINLLEFIRKHELSKVENVELTFKHRKTYSNNLMILFSLYELTFSDVELINKENSLSDISIDKVFSTGINNTLRKIYETNHKDNEIVYKQTIQRKIYGKNSIESFLLSFLEKETINTIQNVKINKFDEVITLLKKIIEVRKNKIIENKHFSVGEKIKFLVEVIYQLSNESLNTNRFKEIDEFIRFFYDNSRKINVSSNNILLIGLKSDSSSHICEVMVNNYKKYFDPKIRQLSDGQLVYFNTYSKIYSKLIEEGKDYPLLLLLDEPDLNLHPEWSRRFINDLIKLINNVNIKRKVQVIISTHSPFMVTDLPSDKVYRITEKGIINKVDISFAANIHDLLLDSFFLDSTMGEFAKFKLKENKKNNIVSEIDDPFLKKLFEEGKIK